MQIKRITSNLTELKMRGYTVYISYETPIAIIEDGVNILFISENIWSKTTGKHIGKLKEMYNDYRTLSHDVFRQYFNIITGEMYHDNY